MSDLADQTPQNKMKLVEEFDREFSHENPEEEPVKSPYNSQK